MLSIKQFLTIGVVTMTVLLSAGCLSTGGRIDVSGPPNETVILQLASSQNTGLGCCSNCLVSAPVILERQRTGVS